MHSRGKLNAGWAIVMAAWDEAVINGHDMLRLEPDCEIGSYTAPCQKCRGWLSSDIAYGMTPYGSVFATKCPGPPPPAPAIRRSEHDRAAAQATGSGEPAERSPQVPQGLNWVDPERVNGPGEERWTR